MEQVAKTKDATLDDLFAAIRLLPFEGAECRNGTLGDLKAIAEQVETPAVPEGDNSLIGRVRRLARLDTEITVAKKRLESLQSQRAALGGGMVNGEWVEGSLMNDLVEAGVPSLQIDGRTVFSRSDVWCFRRKDVDAHAAVVALRRAGLKAFTGETYNAQGLRAWLKERVEAAGHRMRDHGRRKVGKKILDVAELLPPVVRKHFDVQVRTSVATRKA